MLHVENEEAKANLLDHKFRWALYPEALCDVACWYGFN